MIARFSLITVLCACLFIVGCGGDKTIISIVTVVTATPVPTNTPMPTAIPSPTPLPPTATPDLRGGISITVGYPADGVPAMRVYAVDVHNPDAFYYEGVGPSKTVFTFTMSGLPPGTYTILGYPNDNPNFGGAYTPCGIAAATGQGNWNDHSLIPVTVKPQQVTYGIQLDDWYAPAGTFPPRP